MDPEQGHTSDFLELFYPLTFLCQYSGKIMNVIKMCHIPQNIFAKVYDHNENIHVYAPVYVSYMCLR